MILNTHYRFILSACFLFACFMAVAVSSEAQFKQPFNKPLPHSAPFSILTDSLSKRAIPARLPATTDRRVRRPTGITATCNTSTFYMHLTAGAGKKINLKEIQTMTDGNYLLAGNVTLPNTEQEGLLCVMSNAGAVISQKQVRINNRPTTLFNIKTMINGQVAMAGIVHEATDKVFVALLNSDLSVNWLKTVEVTGPISTALDVITDSKFYVAAQAANSVSYFVLDNTGAMVWSKQLNIIGLDNLAGIGHNSLLSQIMLSLNCISAGKKQVQLITVDEATGNILNSNILGDGTTENKTGNVSSFNGRIIATGVTKSSLGGFLLSRQIMVDGFKMETSNTYTIPGAVDFNFTSAHDNAGDVMGYCFPLAGKMTFIRHFAYYQIAPEHAREFSVPVGSAIAGITRSLIDGGYLFAVNTNTTDECIIIKTDSSGILAGCSYENINIDYTEEVVLENPEGSNTINTTITTTQPAIATEKNLTLVSSFDCNQIYCPATPIEDTCLSTYFKALKSNSYVDAFSGYQLMRNNKHLVTTSRIDRVIGDINVITYGVKLLDEKGKFIKGVNVFSNGVSAPVFSRQVDDRRVMLIYNSIVGGIPCFTFTLIDDDLQIIWTKSIKTYANYNFFGAGYSSTIVTDKEGNFYFYGNTGGIFEKAKILVYKMDSNGDPLWLKTYDLEAELLIFSNAAITNTALVMILEGSQYGSVSLSIDKTTGQMLNVYQYQNNGAGAAYNRLVEFYNDRILYAGNGGNGNFVMGIFDTTGKPIKLKSGDAAESILRAGTVKFGKIYAMYNYFTGSGWVWKDVLLKADTSLSFEFAHEFDVIRNGYPSGMAVSEEGNIYVAGNYFYGGSNGAYYDPTLKKFDANGSMGTCSYDSVIPVMHDIDLQTRSVSFTPILGNFFTPINIPITFVADTYGQQVTEILCSSTPTCNSIKLTGTNKVCQINQPFTYHVRRNAGCTIKPAWFYDTAFVVLQTIDDTTAEIKFKKLGSTWIKVKLNAGCSFFTDSMLVQVQQSPGVFSLGNDTAICKGSSLLLNAGNGFNSYLWQDGSTDSVLNVTQPGMYFVSVDNVCEEVYIDTINVQQVNLPALNIGSDTSICKGDTLHLAATPGFNQYAWEPATSVSGQGANVNIYTLQNISVTAIATTIEGCKAYDTLSLSLNTARPVSLGNDTSFCTGDSLILYAGTGYLQYNWNNGAVSPSVTAKQAGMYSVTATDVNGCRAKDTMLVQLYTLPILSLGNDFNLCNGDQRQLDAGNFNQYLWQDGTTGRYYNTSTTGSYWVTVADVHSCTASDTIQVKDILPLPADFLNSTDSICQYEKITIGAIGSFSSYLWSTGAVQPVITADAPGLYTLTVKDTDGCTGTDSMLILQKDCFAGVFIPTAFTPNGDTKNDVFRATVYGSLVAYRLEIFNRFGEMVFSTTNLQKGWDGIFKGVALPTGSFVWQCSYQFAGKSTRFIKGNVVLVR